jgi:hypothetical protein
VISDVELQAGYCLGVSTTQLNGEKEGARKANNAQSRQLHKEVGAIIEERQKRFKDYLVAKGFMADRSPEPLAVAIARGRNDVKGCESELEKPYFKECGQRCRTTYTSAEQIINCAKRCPEPDECKRVKKCLENFLPF